MLASQIFVFWAGVLWLVYVYVGYPLLLALLGITHSIRPKRQDTFEPKVSVLIAARNEEKDIAWKIRETLAWAYPPDQLEVLVASDASDDNTDHIVQSVEDPRLSFLRLATRGGKNVALNQLVLRASGDLLLFTDANAHIGSNSLRLLTRHFADSRVGCVTGSTSTMSEDTLPIGTGASCYWGYESLLQRLESRLGSVLVCDGAIFCVRRSLFRPLVPDLANDVQTPVDVADTEHWVIYEPHARVSEPDTTSVREELSRRRRICAQGVLGFLQLYTRLSTLRRWQFLSHKVLRWLTLLPLMMILCSSLTLVRHPFFSVVTGIQVVAYACAGIGWVLSYTKRSCPRCFSLPFYVVLGIWGVLLGVVDAAIGKRFATWEIPTLSRGQEGAG